MKTGDGIYEGETSKSMKGPEMSEKGEKPWVWTDRETKKRESIGSYQGSKESERAKGGSFTFLCSFSYPPAPASQSPLRSRCSSHS